MRRVAAAKGWWYGRMYQGHEDLCGHGGTRVYRRWAAVEMGLRYWLRHWARLGAVCKEGIHGTCVWMWVKGLGRGRAAVHSAAGQGGLLSWHGVVSGWWISQWQGFNGVCRGLQLCGDDYEQVAHLCTQGTLGKLGSSRHRRRDRWALLSMWGTRTSEGTEGSMHRQFQVDQGMLGLWGLQQLKGQVARAL